jgi:hypothetical protein
MTHARTTGELNDRLNVRVPRALGRRGGGCAMTAAPQSERRQYIAELAEALRPLPGEGDTTRVSTRVLQRLLHLVEMEGATQTAASAEPDETFWLLENHAKASDRFCNAGEAADELLKLTWELAFNVPTTIGGIIATLRHLARIVGPDGASQGYADWLATLHRSLATALERADDSSYPRYVD